MRRVAVLLATLALAVPSTAARAEDDFEFWLNPSVAMDVGGDTELEFETAQRLRDEGNGRQDTYFFRLWVNHKFSKAVGVGAAVERRINTPGANETRTMQQLNLRHGVLRGRARLEQRFIENAAQTGWRLRLRAGVDVPLGDESPWSFFANAEPFITLRATSRTGLEGFSALRTQIGVSREINDNLEVSLGYLRQQDVQRNRPDTVGHAPIVGIELSF